MSGRTVFDVSQAIERQKLGRFLVGLVVISWIITFFDGFDSQAIAFAAPYLSTQYHLDRIMMGNIFSMGLVGTLIGGFAFGYLGDRVGRRPAIILATAAFGLLTLAFVLADGYASLLALRLVDGVALGGMLPLAWALNIEYAPKRYRSTIVTVIMIGLFRRHCARRPDCKLVDSAIRVAVAVCRRRCAIACCGARAGVDAAGIGPLPRQQGRRAAAGRRLAAPPHRRRGARGSTICRR
jgi:hypothetical protein